MYKEYFKNVIVLLHTVKISLIGIVFVFLILLTFNFFNKQTITLITSPLPEAGLPFPKPVQAQVKDNKYEVFGFAPHWSLNKLDNVDFKTLTTLAYFGIPVDNKGNFDTEDPGYTKFLGQKAAGIFAKAHHHGAKVVLTITQMNNKTIKGFLDNDQAQRKTISNTVNLVKMKGLDGVNVDFEYLGNPGKKYREKFSEFVGLMHQAMQREGLSTSVSVYASSATPTKMYDIKLLAENSDRIFMMAYDYSTTASKNAIPTAPLYGHREGKYWYDVSSAVNDFLTHMPAEKLILGMPWYGYNLMVYEPAIKAVTRPKFSWRGKAHAQTYGQIADSINPDMPGILDYQEGWDDMGKTRWKAYRVTSTNTWRMVFYDDVESLGIKYDFAKDKKLAGVGIWALGFDNGRPEMWELLKAKFGPTSHDSQISRK